MSTGEELMELGNIAFEEKKWKQAIISYTQALALVPAESDGADWIYSNRSASHLRAGDFAHALSDAETCIALAPTSYQGYGRKGAVLHAMKRYTDAIAVYEQSLALTKVEAGGEAAKHLRLGLLAAQQAKVQSTPAARAARRTAAIQTMRRKAKILQDKELSEASSTTVTQPTKRASIKKVGVSLFVQQQRLELQLQMIALQTQMTLLEELGAMADFSGKMEFIFHFLDRTHSGTIQSKELAAVLRGGQGNNAILAESLDRAMDMVSIFDDDENEGINLNLAKFKQILGDLVPALACGSSFHDLAEYVVWKIIQSKNADGDDEYELTITDDQKDEKISKLIDATEVKEEQYQVFTLLGSPKREESRKNTIEVKKPPKREESRKNTKEVKEEQHQVLTLLKDPKRAVLFDALFDLFDKNGTQELSFREVAVGFYQMSHDMEDSVKRAIALLLTLDKDDRRTLNYEQFGRLMLATVAAVAKGVSMSDKSLEVAFDKVSRALTLAFTQNSEIVEAAVTDLVIPDEVYQTAADIEKEVANRLQTEEQVGDALCYVRLQKLFDLWDTNGSSMISVAKLEDGLEKFHIMAISGNQRGYAPVAAEEALAFIKTSDEDSTQKLNRMDFAFDMVQFANAGKVNVHELIDYMCMSTFMADDEDDYNGNHFGFQHAYTQPLVGDTPSYMRYYELPADRATPGSLD